MRIAVIHLTSGETLRRELRPSVISVDCKFFRIDASGALWLSQVDGDGLGAVEILAPGTWRTVRVRPALQ